MNEIYENIVFSQAQLLKASLTDEVLRFKSKSGRNTSNTSTDCVLKFVPECFRSEYDKEVAACKTLIEHG